MAEDGNTYNEVSHSMQRRCEGWDYKGRGIYMLTLVVRDMQPLLCTIEEDGNGVRTELTEVGRAVIEETGRICEIYPQIRVLCKQIMPDHLHLLLFVEEALPVHLGKVVKGYKTGTNRAYGRILSATEMPSTGQRGAKLQDAEGISGTENSATEMPSTGQRGVKLQDAEGISGMENSATEMPSTGQRGARLQDAEGISGTENSATEMPSTGQRGARLQDAESISGTENSATEMPSTEQRGTEKTDTDEIQTTVSCAAVLCPAEKGMDKKESEKGKAEATRTGLWAEGYHDRILFHKGQLDALVHYIKDNPRRFALKRANPELFKIRQHLQIAGMSFTAMGNIFLADYPQKAVVQCSRKLHQAEIDAKKADCLEEAVKGMAFVSAAISKGEKQICRAIREAGNPLVVLLEKGFSKPEDPNYKYFKPKGVYFEACAAGKLLLLESEKELFEQAEIEADVVTKAGNIPHETLRYRFLALNAIAERICGKERTPATEVPGTEQRK